MHIIHCTDLWNAHSSYDSGRTDGTGSDPYFYCIYTCIDQIFRCLTGCNIASNHLDLRVTFP